MPSVPQHIAIIMDGNGRWATARGLPRLAGHKAGADAVRRTLEAAKDMGIRYVTLYAFSAENWQRPVDEVEGLMGLLRFYLKSELVRLHSEGVRIRILGDKSAMAADIQEMMSHAETLTAENTAFTLCLAINYGARQEIVQAAAQLAQAGEAVTAESLSAKLYTHGIPDPDLIIRTSGEQRLSNFLLWQVAYSEFYFTPTHWPDFNADELRKAVDDFQTRQRRYGGVGEPTKAEEA